MAGVSQDEQSLMKLISAQLQLSSNSRSSAASTSGAQHKPKQQQRAGSGHLATSMCATARAYLALSKASCTTAVTAM